MRNFSRIKGFLTLIGLGFSALQMAGGGLTQPPLYLGNYTTDSSEIWYAYFTDHSNELQIGSGPEYPEFPDIFPHFTGIPSGMFLRTYQTNDFETFHNYSWNHSDKLMKGFLAKFSETSGNFTGIIFRNVFLMNY